MTPASAEPAPRFDYLLRLGDTALVLSHRLSEWVGSAPTLEEELALANVALDLLGQATSLLALAGEVEDAGRDADALAYLRDAGDYRNVLLVEQPNGDFAHTMLRQFYYDAYAVELWRHLAHSADATLAGIAGKAVKESAYHVAHSGEWVIRLGDGTTESARRIADAVADLWPFTGELFAADAVDQSMAAAGVAPLCSEIEPAWQHRVRAVFADARLEMPGPAWMQSGGKQGRHTEHLGHLLAQMQFLQRAYPGATW